MKLGRPINMLAPLIAVPASILITHDLPTVTRAIVGGIVGFLIACLVLWIVRPRPA